MKPTTAEWVHKAEGDFDGACFLRRSRKRSRFDLICYHCQQCVEKYLKARLNEAGIGLSKTHVLGDLLAALAGVEPLWMVHERAARQLSDAAVAVRCPGASADKAAADSAFKTCRLLRELIRESLGLKG